MRVMENNDAPTEDAQEPNTMNIKQFIDAARQYLFDLAPAQPALATIPVSRVH